MIWQVMLLAAWGAVAASADAQRPFACAQGAEMPRAAGKLAQARLGAAPQAVAIFARFRGEAGDEVPAWAAGLFDAARPGSFSHFYAEMSFGRLRPGGAVAPRRYAARDRAAAYVGAAGTTGDFGRFVREILVQADADIDFARFDNDGPDGVPDSGDDDGAVDAVFVVLESTPLHFLLGGATGIASLGFDEPFITGDRGIGGAPIRIVSTQGTVQQGRTFAEAAGVICHEFGHLLGLPDLFNKRFLSEGGGPAGDSAGIGAWGLMGWGATGWNRDDGPNPFCAWSRVALGWSRVVEPGAEEEEIALEDVAAGGRVYRIPVGADEAFYLAHRRRGGSYYERNLPGEGLVVWHAGFVGSPLARFALDLESADGRWADAGYPLGSEADAEAGGDNLDYWSREAGYRVEHAGNLGDATDPFDGVRFTAFTAATNPSARTHQGRDFLRVEDIRTEGDVVRARVRTQPVRIAVDTVAVVDADGDGALIAGEEAELRPVVANRGGLAAADLRVRLRSDSELLEVVQGEAHYGRLGPGEAVRDPEMGMLRVALTGEFAGNRDVRLAVEVLAGEREVARHEFALRAVDSYSVSGRVTTEDGAGVAGQPVAFFGRGPSRTRTIAETDSAGYYQTLLAPGSYTLSVAAGAGWARIAEERLVFGDERFDLVLERTFPVRGVVRDGAGAPVAAADVSLFSPFVQVATSRQGQFEVALARGRHTITVEKRGADPGQRFPQQSFPVWVAGPTEVEFELKRGEPLRVAVVDESGRGVGSIFVNAWTPGGGEFVQTNAAGVAEVSLIPGIGSVNILQLEPQFLNTSLFPVRVPATAEVRLTVKRGSPLSGRLRGAAAGPPFTGFLTFYPLTRGEPVYAFLDADGSYRAAVDSVRYQAVYFTPESILSLGAFDPADGASVDFAVEPGRLLRGRAVDAAGRGLGAVEVAAISADQIARARTDSQGLFAMPLRRGEYEWTVRAGEPADGGVTFSNLGKGLVEPAEGVLLRQAGGASLRGCVVDATGQPAVEASVFLTDDPLDPALLVGGLRDPRLYKRGASPVALALTDLTGCYDMQVPPGRYWLAALPGLLSGTGVVAGRIAVDGAEERDIALPAYASRHALYGRVALEPDLPRSVLFLRFYDEANGILAQSSSISGFGYQVHLPPGQYRAKAVLLSPVGGLLKVYDVGRVHVAEERRWDIDLNQVPTAVAGAAAVPAGFALAPNYPNPFNPSTQIRYRLPVDAEVGLAVYDALGRFVRRLVAGRQPAGAYQVRWDGRDAKGREAASGVYLYRLTARSQAGAWAQSRKLVLVR